MHEPEISIKINLENLRMGSDSQCLTSWHITLTSKLLYIINNAHETHEKSFGKKFSSLGSTNKSNMIIPLELKTLDPDFQNE
jgi:hypothetical protein